MKKMKSKRYLPLFTSFGVACMGILIRVLIVRGVLVAATSTLIETVLIGVEVAGTTNMPSAKKDTLMPLQRMAKTVRERWVEIQNVFEAILSHPASPSFTITPIIKKPSRSRTPYQVKNPRKFRRLE